MVERDEELLADLLLDWEELHEQGQNVPATELCKTYPHLADELARRIKALNTVAWLDKPIDDAREDLSSADDAQQEPRILAGRYQLKNLLAEGGFAQVWRGFDQELQRYVAIKLPKPNRLNSTDAFIAEARRVASLKHPGIVPVYDVGRDNGVCFIVSELVDGGSLDEIIRRKGFTEEQAIRWLAEIADALQYAHASRIVHQDIKPANILIDQHRRALLTDFGIALTQMQMGTLRYMSPEQLEGKGVDARSDIYSLGVVLHELLSGNQPYSSAEPVALSREILNGASVAGLTKEARRICQKALNRKADARYATASQMADDLRRLILPHSSISSRWFLALPLMLLAVLSPFLWTSLKSSTTTGQPNTAMKVGEIRLLKGGPQVVSVAFSPDGHYLLTGELFQTVCLRDADTGQRIREYQGLKDWVRCVAYAPNGKWIIAGSGGNDDGKGRFVNGSNNLLIRWNVETGEELQRFGPIDSPITTVAILPNGNEVITGHSDGSLRLWDIQAGQEKKRIQGHSAMVRSVAFVPGAPWAISGGGDSMVRLWDLDSSEQIRAFSGHLDTVESVACSSNGKLIVSGAKDNTVRIWDLELGQEIRRLEGHAFHVKSVRFSPDDRTVLSGGFDGTIRLWDAATGISLQVFSGHDKGITSVAFSPDGKLALSGSVDGTARLWALPPWMPGVYESNLKLAQ